MQLTYSPNHFEGLGFKPAPTIHSITLLKIGPFEAALDDQGPSGRIHRFLAKRGRFRIDVYGVHFVNLNEIFHRQMELAHSEYANNLS